MTHRFRYPLRIAAVAAAYYAAARLGLLAAVAQPVVSSAWPPSGVALAALLLLGLRLWPGIADRKSTRLNSSHTVISYAVFCLKKKKKNKRSPTPAIHTHTHRAQHVRRNRAEHCHDSPPHT